ncbi:hypothetical protein GCM10028796_17250 [Ramlibacter monticola]|uniref:Uncharacterized protein n=1 Tax=Ramlibacter monticola TaxID=1926872 RepID=A0A936YYN9_9BURK|nr:hypothetical protein [Ramlibacter monticola]MBL0390551.1 hypothetical protein [Ramlibacter monticola]
MKPVPREQLRDRIDQIERDLHTEWEREPAPAVPQLRTTEPALPELNPIPLWAWLWGVRA